jgi:fibronectin-binding autotransporter adhesin
MKNLAHSPLKLLLSSLCLSSLLVNQTRAGVDYWDPQGTSGSNPYTGDMSGSWEGSVWSTASAGQATPTTWTENNAASFAVHSGAGTPAFTVTMNANHTVAGIFDGSIVPNTPAEVTINGTGIMTMFAGNLNGFNLQNGTGGTPLAVVTINVPIAGGATAGICAENSGQLYLNGANTYTGGTYLGYSGSAFGSGIWYFNSPASFGTGPIYFLNCAGGAFVEEGTSPITITNSLIMWNVAGGALNIVGTPAGVTFSGPVLLSGGSGGTGASVYAIAAPAGGYGMLTLNSLVGSPADPDNLVTVTGPIIGPGGFTTSGGAAGGAILSLTGPNPLLSGPVSVTQGTLRIGHPTALGCIGAISTNGNVYVSSGANLDLNGTPGVSASIVLSGSLVNNNPAATATLQGGTGILSAWITNAFATSLSAGQLTATVTGGGGSGATAAALLGFTPASFTLSAGTQKYTVQPNVALNGITTSSGSNATVMLNLASGNPVSGINLFPGFGYTNDPTSCTVSGGTKTGTGTLPTVAYNAGHMQLMGIQITSPGSGYTSPPQITISGPGGPLTGGAIGLIPSVTLSGGSATVSGPGNIVINSVITENAPSTPLTIAGPGTVTCTANNTYSGSTMINGGRVVGVVGGSCSNSPVYVNSGNAMVVSVPDNTKQWTCAGLSVSSGATLEFDFGFTTPSTTLAPLYVTNSASLSGSTLIVYENSLPGPASYPLMSWGTTIDTTPNLVLPPLASGSLRISGNTLYLDVSSNKEPLRWTGAAGDNLWNINSSQNWKDSTGTAAKYLEPQVPGDAVLLDDTYISTSPSIILNTTINPADVKANNSAHDYTITGSGGIAGDAGLSKQGNGKLTLACTNTYTGDTTISAGTLQLGDGTANNGSLAGNIVNNASLVVANPNPETYTGTISGTGSLTASGSGTFSLGGLNTFSGPTMINSLGGLAVSGFGSLSGGAYAALITDNGTFTYASVAPQTLSGAISGSGSFVQNGPGTLTLTAVNSYNTAISIGAGATLTIGGAGVLGSGSYANTITDNGTLAYASSAAQAVPGTISGTGVVVENGPGILTLSGANTFSGGTTITTGGLVTVNSIADSGTSALSTSGTLTLAGGTLQYTGAASATTSRTVSGSGTIDLPSGNLELLLAKSGTIIKTSGGTLTLSGTADNSGEGVTINNGTVILNKTPSTSTVHALGGTATTVNNGGRLVLSGTGLDQIYSGATEIVNNGGVFDANGVASEGWTSLTLNGTGSGGTGALVNSVPSSTTVLTCTAASAFPLASDSSIGGTGNLTLSGVMSGAHALTYVGSGLLKLTSAETYTGATTVSSGTLEVVTNLASTSITVANGAGLQLDMATALSASSSLVVGSAATGVNLNFAGTNTINFLSLNGGTSHAAAGVWSSPTASPAAPNTSSLLTGNGYLNVAHTFSTTNIILSITNNGNNTFTINVQGTPGANYYLVSTGAVSASFATWPPVKGSTNTAAIPGGKWSYLATNAAPAYFRSMAVNPGP